MTTEQLQPYCHPDATRHKICTPYRDGEWVIATNGRILIRVPYVESIHGDIRADGLNTKTTFQGTEKAETPTVPEAGWEAMPSESKSCPWCNGLGAWNQCETCEGSCEVECDECGHTNKCEDCNGKGHISSRNGSEMCDECDGTGTLMNWPVIQLIRPGLAPLFISSNYLKLIMDLPGVQIFTHRYDDNRTPHLFTFEGGDGIFMTIRKPTRPQP